MIIHLLQGKKDDLSLDKNYLFYINKIPYEPHGVEIDNFHEFMWGQYGQLEWNHSYIQWYVNANTISSNIIRTVFSHLYQALSYQRTRDELACSGTSASRNRGIL